jgi:hypothetical protein
MPLFCGIYKRKPSQQWLGFFVVCFDYVRKEFKKIKPKLLIKNTHKWVLCQDIIRFSFEKKYKSYEN